MGNSSGKTPDAGGFYFIGSALPGEGTKTVSPQRHNAAEPQANTRAHARARMRRSQACCVLVDPVFSPVSFEHDDEHEPLVAAPPLCVSVQLHPRAGIRFTGLTKPRMLRLPQSQCCASGIGKDAEPACVHHLQNIGDDGRPEGFGLFGGSDNIVDQDVR